ncbi:MAG: hypothetical protein AWU57_508 [Marinobacter sp. T13-3]|nr:MAG: hypothetical protein AWU57_508 [Marinobacter sp. T13-3]
MAGEARDWDMVSQLLNEEADRKEREGGESAPDEQNGTSEWPDSYTTKTYNVPDFRADTALKHLNALSIKAVKLGMPAFEVESGEPFLTPADGTWGIEKGKVRMIPFTVTGGPPMIEGWRFLAKIDHDDQMNIVQGFGVDETVEKEPGFLKHLQSCEPNCEHCNLKRNRNTTFIFQSVDDPAERIQVGSTCVDDFSGHNSPDQVISLATRWLEVIRDYFDPDDDGFDKPSRGQMHFEVEDVLAAGAAIVREHGHWVSRDSADLDGSSAVWVQQLILDSKSFSEVVKPCDEQEAADILAWLRSDAFDDKGNSYLGNLKAMAIREAVPFKYTGFLASGVATWHREQGYRQKQAEKPQANMKLGEPGEKITLDATVEKVIFIDNQFGGSDLNILRDNDTGAKLVWFNSGRRTMDEGDSYHITGTVKGHEQRDDLWQTKLTRVNSPEAMLAKQLKDKPENTKAIQKKIKATHHINARDGRGDTPLLIASYYHQNTMKGREVIDALLDAGADYTIESNYSMTPFDHWVVAGDVDLIERALTEHPELAKGWTEDDLAKEIHLTDDDRVTVAALLAKAKTAATAEHDQPRAQNQQPRHDQEQYPAPKQSSSNDAAHDLGLDDDEEDLAGIRLG